MVDTSTEAVTKLLDGVTQGRAVQFHPRYCDEAKYAPFGDWDTSHHVSVIRDDGSRYRVAEFRHSSDAAFYQTARDLVPALLAEREAQAARADAADADVARRLEMHECAMAERDDCIEDWSKANDRIKALLAERDALKKERDEAIEGWHVIHPNITVQDAARALLDADGCPNERICEIADEIHGAGASMNRAICVALRAIADTD